MSNHQQSLTLLRNHGQQQSHHLTRGLRIQCAGRLIRESHGGTVHLGAGNRHTLSLTTGHLTHTAVQHLPQTQTVQQISRNGTRLLAGNTGNHRGEGDVLLRGQLGNQQTLLEHETKRVSAQGGALTLAEGLHRHLTGRAVEQHRTGIELDNARERVQQGGLTGTGRTHNRHGLTGENIQAHVT